MISLETGKKKNLGKKIYTQQEDIIGALNVSKKTLRGGRLHKIIEVTKEQYEAGRDIQKYSRIK